MRPLLLMVVLLAGCGLPNRARWTPEVSCDTRFGHLMFQRAPKLSCDEISKRYGSLADELMDPITGHGANAFSLMEVWVWDRDHTRDEPLDQWDTTGETVWMDRCLTGLVHEQLHYWEVRFLGTPAVVANRHWRWKSDDNYRLADLRWIGQSRAICAALTGRAP
ncbi:MAG TPA: hypothetical protein VFR62_14725 [Gemmatimonadales bacterium]|nr:hypothetical protein [Gemmatimonadales bacterium]